MLHQTPLRVTIILPFVLYSVIFNALTRGLDLRLRNAQVADAVFKAKAISSGVFVGSILIFWVPMLVWKMIVSRRTSEQEGQLTDGCVINFLGEKAASQSLRWLVQVRHGDKSSWEFRTRLEC